MKLSVIIPTYNMENFIVRALNCLKEQDVDDAEFLVINDGSTDNTPEILLEHTRDDSRFNIISIGNHGYGYACNLGILQAKGEFFAIYEPDDVIESDFYSTLMDTVKNYSHADIIRYNGFYKNNNGNIHKLYTWKEKYTGKMLDKYENKQFWRSHPSIYNGIYRTEFFRAKKIFLCETPGASFQDSMLMVSLFYSNPSIYIINQAKYYYTIHEKQSVNNLDSKIDYVFMNWKCEENWLKENGFHDKSYFLYKIFIDTYSMCKKTEDINKRNRILAELSNLLEFKFLFCSIAKISHQIKYLFFYIKSIANTKRIDLWNYFI